MSCLSAFDHFVGLVLKGSKGLKLILFQEPNYSHTKVIPTEDIRGGASHCNNVRTVS